MAATTAEKLIFNTSIDPLVKIARGKVTEDTRQKLEKLRIFFDKKVDPAYPAEAWATAVKLISAELHPRIPADEQHRALGKDVVMQFADTIIGKAMFATARLIGAKRSMARLTNNLRTGANFIQTRFTEIDDRKWELWINDVTDVPGFYAGLIGAGSHYMESWADRIDIKARDGASCLYELVRTR